MMKLVITLYNYKIKRVFCLKTYAISILRVSFGSSWKPPHVSTLKPYPSQGESFILKLCTKNGNCPEFRTVNVRWTANVGTVGIFVLFFAGAENINEQNCSTLLCNAF